MKLLLTYMLLVIGQVAISQCQFYVVGNDQLFSDKYNRITIAVHGKKIELFQYTVSVSSGDYFETDSGLFVKPHGLETTIVLTSKATKDTVGYKSFVTVPLPEPLIALDGKVNGGEISRHDLSLLKGVTALVPSHFYHYNILSFQATFRLGNEQKTLINRGALLSDSVKTLIGYMRPYDQLILHSFETNPMRFLNKQIVLTIKKLDFVGDDYVSLCEDYAEVSLTKTEFPTYQKSVCNDCIVNSDCRYSVYECNLKVICIEKEQVYTCTFYNRDSSVVTIFYGGNRLADISYYNNALSGPFTLYDRFGLKVFEGNFKRGGPISNVSMIIDPVTLSESSTDFEYTPSFKDGYWHYYANGKIVRSVKYENGQLTK